MTQTYPTTEAITATHPEQDDRAVSRRLDYLVQREGVHYLGTSRYQVNEHKGFYIPDVISGKRDSSGQEYFSAAFEHSKHLTKAQALVGDAMHLVRMMSEARCGEGDRRAMQTNVACDVIEEKLRKAYNRIDKHDRRHTNLFLAYFDLKHKADLEAQD